jgi:hypothetical protein
VVTEKPPEPECSTLEAYRGILIKILFMTQSVLPFISMPYIKKRDCIKIETYCPAQESVYGFKEKTAETELSFSAAYR